MRSPDEFSGIVVESAPTSLIGHTTRMTVSPLVLHLDNQALALDGIVLEVFSARQSRGRILLIGTTAELEAEDRKGRRELVVRGDDGQLCYSTKVAAEHVGAANAFISVLRAACEHASAEANASGAGRSSA